MLRVFTVCVLLATAGNSVAQTFACQYVASSGLIWKSGAWKATEFKTDSPFFLTVKGKTLDEKSVTKVLGAIGVKWLGSESVTCNGNASRFINDFYLGSVLYFNTKKAKGAVAHCKKATTYFEGLQASF